jgi:hypothetical protein
MLTDDQIDAAVRAYGGLDADNRINRESMRRALLAASAAPAVVDVSDGPGCVMHQPTAEEIEKLRDEARKISRQGIEWMRIEERAEVIANLADLALAGIASAAPAEGREAVDERAAQWEISSIANELWQVADQCGYEQFRDAVSTHLKKSYQDGWNDHQQGVASVTYGDQK